MMLGQFMKLLALCGYPPRGGSGESGLKPSGVLAQSGVASSISGSTAETTLAIVVVPANTIGVNGCLRIHTQWTYSSNTNTKHIGGYFGLAKIIQLAGSTQASVTFLRSIRNRNSLTTQVMESLGSSGASTSAGSSTVLQVDTTQDQTLAFTARLTDPTDTVTLEAYTVEILNP